MGEENEKKKKKKTKKGRRREEKRSGRRICKYIKKIVSYENVNNIANRFEPFNLSEIFFANGEK